MSLAPFQSSTLRIALGGPASKGVEVGLPVLAGEPVEALFGPAHPAGTAADFALFETDAWLLGVASVPVSPSSLEASTSRIYENLLAAARGLHLARVWNYVPAINASGAGGLENYRVFCRGRSLAFERYYGVGYRTLLPAASAVGTASDRLTVAFAASRRELRHWENPLQVPAYDYPSDYGPRAPSFARATVVAAEGRQRPAVFISGTAAIRGHTTMAVGDTARQVDFTVENLRAVSAACGLGPDLGAAVYPRRHFKVYLRDPADWAPTAAQLDRTLFHASDAVSYLHADICRASLRVEIEATLV